MNCNLPRVKIHSSTASKSSLIGDGDEGLLELQKCQNAKFDSPESTTLRGSAAAKVHLHNRVNLYFKAKWFLSF